MAPRLKVFVTSDGLTDYVVATTSKTKALAAWGSHQDLFKTGLAHQTDDPALVKAATAQPDEVLRRPAGTRGDLAKLKPPKPKKAAAPSKAALNKVADLERRISAAEAAHARALEAIERKRLDLERQQSELEAKHQAAVARLNDQLSAAKRALGS
jgi:hypothetical protein